MPESVTTMGSGVFWKCKKLENVVLSSNLTSIESWTFYQCDILSNIIIPDKNTIQACEKIVPYYKKQGKEDLAIEYFSAVSDYIGKACYYLAEIYDTSKKEYETAYELYKKSVYLLEREKETYLRQLASGKVLEYEKNKCPKCGAFFTKQNKKVPAAAIGLEGSSLWISQMESHISNFAKCLKCMC